MERGRPGGGGGNAPKGTAAGANKAGLLTIYNRPADKEGGIAKPWCQAQG